MDWEQPEKTHLSGPVCIEEHIDGLPESLSSKLLSHLTPPTSELATEIKLMHLELKKVNSRLDRYEATQATLLEKLTQLTGYFRISEPQNTASEINGVSSSAGMKPGFQHIFAALEDLDGVQSNVKARKYYRQIREKTPVSFTRKEKSDLP